MKRGYVIVTVAALVTIGWLHSRRIVEEHLILIPTPRAVAPKPKPAPRHRFSHNDLVRLEAPKRGPVQLYFDMTARENNDTSRTEKTQAGTYARVEGAYRWSDDLEVRVVTGVHGGRGEKSVFTVRREDCMWLDGRTWRR